MYGAPERRLIWYQALRISRRPFHSKALNRKERKGRKNNRQLPNLLQGDIIPGRPLHPLAQLFHVTLRPWRLTPGPLKPATTA